jgi:hypothetical protein
MNYTEDPIAKQEMLEAVKLIHLEYEKMNDSREHIKDIIIALYAKHKIPKPILRKVARVYHKRNANELMNEASEINSIYKSIINVK